MSERFIIALLLFSTLQAEAPTSYENFFILWNVGQGQTSTYFTKNLCLHFDMGGEYFPKQLQSRCSKKENVIFLSHADWDHINFVPKILKYFPRVCLHTLPIEPLYGFKKKWIHRIPICPTQKTKNLPFEVLVSTHKSFKKFKQHKKPNNNVNSRIALLHKQILIPGDSPQSEEIKWIQQLQSPSQIKLLILGHHGSKTSTSTPLLMHLPHLKMAISSARYKRYGHPHHIVRARLKTYKIPLLRTEDWGNFIYGL